MAMAVISIILAVRIEVLFSLQMYFNAFPLHIVLIVNILALS
jgi:hypothetical protein